MRTLDPDPKTSQMPWQGLALPGRGRKLVNRQHSDQNDRVMGHHLGARTDGTIKKDQKFYMDDRSLKIA